jgi:hypothetical protein
MICREVPPKPRKRAKTAKSVAFGCQSARFAAFLRAGGIDGPAPGRFTKRKIRGIAGSGDPGGIATNEQG